MFLTKQKFCIFYVISIFYITETIQDDTQGGHKFTSALDETQIQEGQSSYSVILRNSQMPQYGLCWKEALNKLESGCKQLTEETQGRLSVHFTNCFLATSGENTYSCDSSTPLSECIKQMDLKAFTSYVSHHAQTRSICQFLQMVNWQEATENTVNKLSDKTVKVVQTLENSNELQKSILEKQVNSLLQQEKLLESSSLLGQALDMSEDKVKNMLEEFRVSTSEQKHMIFEIFDRMSKFQNVVLGEVTGFYSLIFYPSALLTVYLLTSTTRTAAARFWLFMLFCSSLVVERTVMWLTINDDMSYLPADEAYVEIFCRIWELRKVVILAGIAILCYFAYTFRDLNVVNNAILVQIQRQNQEMQHYLERIGSPGTSNLKLLKTDTFSSRFRSLDTSDQSRIQNESSDSEFSYDSDASDKTYIPKKDVSTDEETFETAPSEPSSNVASPEMSPVRIPIKKITRKKSFMTPTTPSPYNLRSRASLTSPFRSSLMPVPASESPETFGRIVQKMERISKKNATKLIETLQNSMQGTSYYSSDGE